MKQVCTWKNNFVQLFVYRLYSC